MEKKEEKEGEKGSFFRRRDWDAPPGEKVDQVAQKDEASGNLPLELYPIWFWAVNEIFLVNARNEPFL